MRCQFGKLFRYFVLSLSKRLQCQHLSLRSDKTFWLWGCFLPFVTSPALIKYSASVLQDLRGLFTKCTKAVNFFTGVLRMFMVGRRRLIYYLIGMRQTAF